MPISKRVDAVSRLLARGGGPPTAFNSGMVARKHVVTSSASLAPGAGSVKANQAWKYPNGKIQRAQHLLKRGYHDHKDKDLGRRKQESNFMITINTNKAPDPEHQADAEKRLTAVLKRLEDARAMSQYFIFGPSAETGYNYQKDKFTDVIEDVEFKAGVETGPQQNRVHAHIWLTVHHYSQIQVNGHVVAQITKDIFNSAGGELGKGHPLRITKKPYVHIKLLPQCQWMEIIKGYMMKGMGTGN